MKRRVWHSEANLNRRQICFDIAAKRNVHPIEVALAYVIQTSSLIYPLIGPRTVFETDSSISAVSMNLTNDEMEKLSRRLIKPLSLISSTEAPIEIS